MKTERNINLDEVPDGFWKSTLRSEDIPKAAEEMIFSSVLRPPTVRPLTSLEKLMIAVLEDTLRVLWRGGGSKTVNTQRDQDLDWVRSRKSQYILSFERICLELGLDSDRVRHRIKTVMEADNRPRVRVRYNAKGITKVLLPAQPKKDRSTRWTRIIGKTASVGPPSP